jgi:hypothetical protein
MDSRYPVFCQRCILSLWFNISRRLFLGFSDYSIIGKDFDGKGYAPQYICDYAKSLGFDGMQYPSTMYQDGFNVAVFDEHLFHCVETVVYDVTSLSYSFNAAC